MFKINQSAYDEVLEQLEINLKKTASDKITENESKLLEALKLLNSSAELLDNFGFEKEASAITKLMVIASHFPESEFNIPIIYLIKDDPEFKTFCPHCAKKIDEKHPGIMKGFPYEEGPIRECEVCKKDLESAFGNPDEDENYGKSKDNYDTILNDLEDKDEDQVII